MPLFHWWSTWPLGMEYGAVDLEYGDGVIRDAIQCLKLILKDTLLQPLDQN